MPYYRWVALNITGMTLRGKLFAHNVQDVDSQLLEKNLGLISARPIFSAPQYMVRKKDIAQAFKDLAHLLQAKVQIYQACTLVASMQKNAYLQSVFHACAQSLYQGASLDMAISWHKDIISTALVGLIRAGQETGKLAETLEKIADHQLMIEKMKSQMLSLLLMPIITFISFITLVVVFFTLIIPRFEIFFASFDNEIPALTRYLIHISHLVQNITMFHIIGFLLIIIGFSWLWKKRLNKYFHHVLMKLPVKSLFITWHVAYVMQLLSILVGEGIALPAALRLVSGNISNQYIAKDFAFIVQEVAEGKHVTQACKASVYFSQDDLQVILKLGESTSELASMLKQAAHIYQTRSYTQLKGIVSLSQPISLIILGALIAGLLYCLYIPIFSVSNIVM